MVLTVKLKGINKVRKRLADGSIKIHYYHRATGTRLNGHPQDKQFLDEYQAAERKALAIGNGDDFAHLVRLYSSDDNPEFQLLAESTRKEYKRILKTAEDQFGTLPRVAIEDPRVLQDFTGWRAKVAKSSGLREGDNRLSVVSAMFTWARQNGHLLVNHLHGFKRLHYADRSDKIWLPESIDAFMRKATIEIQRALILALHTGLRQGDCRKVSKAHYDGAALTLRINKNKRNGKEGRLVTIPCTRTLKRMIDELPDDQLLILVTETGRPWQARWFKEQWKLTSDSAGITDLHFHDLRGTAVTMLSEAGCTPQEIATITGLSLRTINKILDVYLARTRVLADNAIHRFENAPATRFANRLQTGAQKTRPKLAK